MYELYVINNCNYLLKYNYQTGIIQSDDTLYIAIINNKPVTITLQKNLFNRKGFSAKKLNYNIIYTNGVEISTRDSSYNKIIVENEDIKNSIRCKRKMSFCQRSFHRLLFRRKLCYYCTYVRRNLWQPIRRILFIMIIRIFKV